MIKVGSIERVFKNESAVLKALVAGANIKDAATLCGVSYSTAQGVRNKHVDKLPMKKKRVVSEDKKLGKPFGWRKSGPKSVMRSMRVPGDLDVAVVQEARERSMEYHHLIFEILRGRYEI